MFLRYDRVRFKLGCQLSPYFAGDCSVEDSGICSPASGTILAAASILGELPDQVIIVGVEPERLQSGTHISDPVRNAVPTAVERAQAVLDEMLASASAQPPQYARPSSSSSSPGCSSPFVYHASIPPRFVTLS